MCESLFDVWSCSPEAFPDKPFFRVDQLPGTVSLAANDRVFSLPQEFLWTQEHPEKASDLLRVSEAGLLSVDAAIAPGIHRMRYRMCLKSGTWCSPLVDVELFVLGQHHKQQQESDVGEPGLMRREALQKRAGAFPTPLECTNTSVIGNLVCTTDPGCPYGYDDNWNCVEDPPIDYECADAAWKAELAKLWAAYFKGSTNINTFFDGMLAQQPCTNCKPAAVVL